MKNLTWKRIRPGYYKSGGYEIIQHEEGGMWFVTYPGQQTPDDATWTLRDAKAECEHHNKEHKMDKEEIMTCEVCGVECDQHMCDSCVDDDIDATFDSGW